MRRYDPDTIAALAEGRLDPERARELERAIAADPIAAAELADHRLALAATKGAPSPMLSVDERAGLRSAISSALGLEAPASATSGRALRRVPWAAVTVAALSLVALVAAAPLANLLSTGEDAAAAPTFGAIEGFSTTAATLSSPGDTAAPLPTDGLDAPAAADLAATEAATTTTTTTDTIRVAAGDPEERSLLLEAFDAASIPPDRAVEPDDDTPCVALGREDPGGTPLYTISFTAKDDATIVVFYTLAEDGSLGTAIGYDAIDCSVRVSYP